MSKFDVQITASYGWDYFTQNWGEAWIKGYIFDYKHMQDFVEELYKIIEKNDEAYLRNYLSNIDGHYAIVIKTPKIFFASVDRVRSIPLFFLQNFNNIIITDQPEKLNLEIKYPKTSSVQQDRLMFQMSGYCSGRSTLMNDLIQLQSGEYLKSDETCKLKFNQFYNYVPSIPEFSTSKRKLKNSLENVTLNILKKIIDSADGRTIVVPLSGGYDSRLVASGFAYLGYKNVKCFSYGKKNNFESLISKKVAKKLGYEWKFIRLTHEIIKTDYYSKLHQSYIKFSNTFCSVPVEHEFSAVRLLKKSDWIPKDAIFVNGMSGDYLTGSHIPKTLLGNRSGLTDEMRKKQILEALINKHYSLWRDLDTPNNRKFVANSLWNEIKEEAGGLSHNINNDYGLYEFSEFKNRQSKYVITVQRVYEFFGYEWRLPLWDRDYLDYWVNIDPKFKLDRNLFVKVMHELDWGGVWKMELPNSYIVPWWTALLRFLMKGIFVFIGKDKWKLFDKKFFYYWTEILCKMGIVSYSKVVFDRRGYRNAVSWLSDDYLYKLKNKYDVSKYESKE